MARRRGRRPGRSAVGLLGSGGRSLRELEELLSSGAWATGIGEEARSRPGAAKGGAREAERGHGRRGRRRASDPGAANRGRGHGHQRDKGRAHARSGVRTHAEVRPASGKAPARQRQQKHQRGEARPQRTGSRVSARGIAGAHGRAPGRGEGGRAQLWGAGRRNGRGEREDVGRSAHAQRGAWAPSVIGPRPNGHGHGRRGKRRASDPGAARRGRGHGHRRDKGRTHAEARPASGKAPARQRQQKHQRGDARPQRTGSRVSARGIASAHGRAPGRGEGGRAQLWGAVVGRRASERPW
nr:hornerin-like [Aegilops tauschii subsp. strangulata]